MSIKAKEEVKSSQLGGIAMLLSGVFLVVYVFVYNKSISMISDYALKTGIGVAAILIMCVLFFVVLRFIKTNFYLLLTHQNLCIERKTLFYKKEVANIAVKDMMEVLPEEQFKGINGKVKKYTLGRIENKAKYIIVYKEAGVVVGAKIQCSSKFFKTLKTTMKK